jgi:hypothetical protein
MSILTGLAFQGEFNALERQPGQTERNSFSTPC